MTITLNAVSITLFSLMLLVLVITSYLAAGYILDYFKFKEPNDLRSKVLADVNLDRRSQNLYNYLAWHIEDCTQIQPLQLGEAMMLASYITANAIEGMGRSDTSETLRKINEMARELKNQTRQPHRKDDSNVVELTVKDKDEVTGDGASIH